MMYPEFFEEDHFQQGFRGGCDALNGSTAKPWRVPRRAQNSKMTFA